MMFCDEIIEEVYECLPEYDDSVNHFLDCYHDMALHLTRGYRLILKTKTYFICIGYEGVKVVLNTQNITSSDEYMEPCIHIINAEDEACTWVNYESTLFTGERLIDVKA